MNYLSGQLEYLLIQREKRGESAKGDETALPPLIAPGRKTDEKRFSNKLHSTLARSAAGGRVKTTGWCARLRASTP